MEIDLDVFVNPDEIGIEATFTHGSTAATFDGLFIDAFKLVNPATGNVESSSPQIECKTSDVSTAVHGDNILIGTVNYKVIGIQPSEDKLMTVLILSRQGS
jgi:hypothetical protein